MRKRTTEESDRLKKGKKFHKVTQTDWVETAEADGDIATEAPITKPPGKGGRVDVLVPIEDNFVAVVEVKDSDWDRMADKAARRNVRRQIRQVWDFIESQLEQGNDVAPGIVFPKRPTDPDRMKLVEEMFEEDGIPVIWGTILLRRRRGDDQEAQDVGFHGCAVTRILPRLHRF